MVIYLSHPVEYTKNRLADPDRLYFDLRKSRIVREVQSRLSVGDGILKSVRAAQFNEDTVRVVLDLETIEDYNVFFFEEPTRMVIDINAKRPERLVTKRIIVLDPGHGGHDPGAVGAKGLMEKDVVLDIAMKARKLLPEDPSIDVHLTRETDVFISLEDRTGFARKKDADLFVSVHANASPNRSARGIETYLLNWTNEEEAIRVAARENYISVKRMKERLAQYRKDDYVGIRAVRAPRFHHQWSPDSLASEEEALSGVVSEGLTLLGHHLAGASVVVGAVQAIYVDPATGAFIGVPDPREGGTAAGY